MTELPLKQGSLFSDIEEPLTAEDSLSKLLRGGKQPAALDLLRAVETGAGMQARWELVDVIRRMAESSEWTRAIRDYLISLLETEDLVQALRGEKVPDRDTISSIDLLLQQSARYRQSAAFQEMIDFVGRFRGYSPFNNMLVRVQNPSCGYYATARDWADRFGRTLKQDARPMLILAPMHPVMLVYDLDQTEGESLPEELERFAKFEGQWKPEWLERMVKNAEGHRIQVEFKPLSSTSAGFATVARGAGKWKMRIAVHDGLDGPSRCGTLCHELAHILLGHLGSDVDHWWPARTNLTLNAIEVEAEAVAWIVMRRLGLSGGSQAYVSHHIRDDRTPDRVSPDSIAKVASLVERMAQENLPPRRPRTQKKVKK